MEVTAMRALHVTGLALLALLTAAPEDAAARGGNYRGPNGAVPPMLREPTDPTPPPPPRIGGSRGGAVPTPPPPSRPPPMIRPTPNASFLSFVNWRFWYHNNHEVLEPRSAAAIALAREGALAKEHVLPALRAVLDPKQATDEPVRHAALVALGKLATTPEHVELLRAKASISRDVLQDESAIIALGLLRRSDPTARFAPGLLDAVRGDLLRILASDKRPVRQRAFAAAAIGLLGDQPVRSEAGSKALTAKLFALLEERHRHPDVQGSILLAIGLRPRHTITQEQRAILHAILESGTIDGRRVYSSRTRAALALGRIGRAEDVPALVKALGNRSARGRNGERAAAVALGSAVLRLGPEARGAFLRDAMTLLVPPKPDPDSVQVPPEPLRDPSVRCLLLITLARVAVFDLRGTDGLTGRVAGVEGFLRTQVAAGKPGERAYAALALAWLGRPMRGSANAERVAFLRRTGALLRKQLADKSQHKRERGAYAVALGLIGDAGSKEPLQKLLGDLKEDVGLRGAAARALGLLPGSDAKVRTALEKALASRRSETLRIDCSAGLGLLGNPDAGPALLAELAAARSLVTKGSAAVALGNLGARAPVKRLVATLRDPGQPALLRAVAAAALGRIADPEPVPSLARLTAHTNYRAMSDFLNELFALL